MKQSYTYTYQTPNCTAMSREPTNTAFWCGLTGNSPLCGVELNMIHFSKTTDKATTTQLCQNVKLQFWSVGCHYLYHNNTVPGTNMLTLTYLVSHAEQQP